MGIGIKLPIEKKIFIAGTILTREKFLSWLIEDLQVIPQKGASNAK